MTAPSPRQPTTDEILAEFRIFFQYSLRLSREESTQKITGRTTLKKISEIDDENAFDGFDTHFGLPISFWTEKKYGINTTLLEVAHDIAPLLEVLPITPVTILGKTCDSAGLFLEIKRALVSKGEDERAIAPSTNLVPYVRRHPDLFARFRWFAPGRVPVLLLSNRLFGLVYLLLFASLTFLFLELFAQKRFLPASLNDPLLISLTAVAIGSLLIGRVYRDHFDCFAYCHLTDFRSLVHTILGREIVKKKPLKQST